MFAIQTMTSDNIWHRFVQKYKLHNQCQEQSWDMIEMFGKKMFKIYKQTIKGITHIPLETCTIY